MGDTRANSNVKIYAESPLEDDGFKLTKWHGGQTIYKFIDKKYADSPFLETYDGDNNIFGHGYKVFPSEHQQGKFWCLFKWSQELIEYWVKEYGDNNDRKITTKYRFNDKVMTWTKTCC